MCEMKVPFWDIRSQTRAAVFRAIQSNLRSMRDGESLPVTLYSMAKLELVFFRNARFRRTPEICLAKEMHTFKPSGVALVTYA